MDVLDLFCGCGGLSNGFLKAGFNIPLAIDHDQSALTTYSRNHKNTVSLNTDLETLTCEEIVLAGGSKEFDVIIGGPPCQGVSLSGKRDSRDQRNSLLGAFSRIVKELQPSAFVMENVPGLLGLYGGSLKDALVNDFQQAGYQLRISILSAAAFGVPQLRKRVFIVGLRNVSKTFEFPDPTHVEIGSLFRQSSDEYVTCGEALSDLPPLVDEIGRDFHVYESDPDNYYQKLMRQNSEGVFNHIAAEHSNRIREIIRLVPEGGNYKDLPDIYKNTRNFHVAWTRYHSGYPAPTVDTGHRHHFHYKYDRVPTVRETARLQSFSDDFIFEGTKTDQFKQVGNAVPPLLAYAVANRLKEYL